MEKRNITVYIAFFLLCRDEVWRVNGAIINHTFDKAKLFCSSLSIFLSHIHYLSLSHKNWPWEQKPDRVWSCCKRWSLVLQCRTGHWVGLWSERTRQRQWCTWCPRCTHSSRCICCRWGRGCSHSWSPMPENSRTTRRQRTDEVRRKNI